MEKLTSGQKKYLRSLAHHLDPVVMVGKQGVTDGVIAKVNESLDSHELIKIRYLECKNQKKAMSSEIAARTQSILAGTIGHVAILYRRHEDPDKRKIKLPEIS
jgi:RNA-binding protein